MKIVKKYYYNIFLIISILIGVFFRFYNLNWDQGYLFNPDEANNIAFPAANLKFPYNPNHFTYGSLTIYLYRLGAQVIALISNNQNWLTVAGINMVGRFFSAVFSTILIFIIYLIGKKLYSRNVGIMTAFLVAVNVGLIQAAHFGTTETILALAGALIFLGLINILDKEKYPSAYLSTGVILGAAISAKISALIFLPSFFIAHLFSLFNGLKFKFDHRRNLFFILGFILVIITFVAISPYTVLDYKNSFSSFKFEEEIATGKIPVFFTVQFKETVPYIFQFIHVLPWIIGWPIVILALFGFFSLSYEVYKKINRGKAILLIFPLVYFLYTSSIFVKWTRYMVPLIPFFCLFASIFLINLYQKTKKYFPIKIFLFIFLLTVLLLQFFYACAFLKIYLNTDTRIAASDWIYKNIAPKNRLLLEPYDVISLPLPRGKLNSFLYKQGWFDFYFLDNYSNNREKWDKISNLSIHLADTDYIIIGSRRIWANRMRLKTDYPQTNRYYSLLFDGSLGFQKIKEISVFPNLFGLQLNDNSAEETFQVFDHPQIMIFKNLAHLKSEEIYKNLLLY